MLGLLHWHTAKGILNQLNIYFLVLPSTSAYLPKIKLTLCGYNEMRYLWKIVFEINVLILFVLNATVQMRTQAYCLLVSFFYV